MRRLPPGVILLLLVLMALLLPLVALAPRSHQTDQELRAAHKALSTGDALKASEHVARAAEQSPLRPDLWELAGRYALQGGDLSTAIQYLEQAAALSDPSIQLLTDLGDAYKQSGDLPAALQAWQSAAERSGYPVELILRLLDAHLSLAIYDAAILDLKTLLVLQPDEPRWPYQLGLLSAIRDPQSALEYLEQAAELDPSLEPAVASLRQAILRAGNVEEPAYLLLEIGRALAGLEQWSLAVLALQQATALRPDYAEAWAYLGEALQHRESPENRLAGILPASPGRCVFLPDSTLKPDDECGLIELQAALRLDPNSLAAQTFLSVYWTRRARPDLALPAIHAALALDPGQPALLVQLASVLAATGDFAGAHQAYQQAIEQAPYNPAYRRYLVSFALQYNYQVEQIAMPLARQLAISEPGDPANLDLFAQVLIKRGDLSSAMRFLHRALELDTQYAPAHLHLGLALVLQGDLSTGRQELEQALNLARHGPVADQAQRLLETHFP